MKTAASDDVRFGGRRGPKGYVFELTGGALCLDFANTVDERPTDTPRELLRSYDDLLAWGVQSGAVTRAHAASLAGLAAARPPAAARALLEARRVRERLFALFSALAAQRTPPSAALAALNRALPRAYAFRSLAHSKGRFVWASDPHKLGLDAVLATVLLSAVDLLTSPLLLRVRQCGGAGCDWLFLDLSKSGTRRWCDMSVCGNRAKARRHRAREHHRTGTLAR